MTSVKRRKNDSRPQRVRQKEARRPEPPGRDAGKHRAWGIEPGYLSALHEWHDAPEASLEYVKKAMARRARTGRAFADVWVLTQGETRAIAEPAELRLEDGTAQKAGSHLPRDLPLGYHELVSPETGGRIRVVVTPGRCHLPDDLFTWGWAVQLYAVRSKKSWGMGDFGDLRALAQWSSRLGAGTMLINPLHAPLPSPQQQPSPYYPSTRLYRNPLYLRIEDVPGAERLARELEPLRESGAALNESGRIDRDSIFDLKMRALAKIFTTFKGSREFDRYRAAERPYLGQYATFCVLVEKRGPNWRKWPRELRDPKSAAVAKFRRSHEKRAVFHEWLQWQLDAQLRQAGRAIPLLGDLAVGVDAGGADAWLWQDVFTEKMGVGAPPDDFNTLGQDWGLLPFDPHALRGAGYEPFIRIVRSAMRHMGGMRLDHVMGLFRLFWIPAGKKPKDGVYVRYPALDLLGIVALESARAKAYVVGEDLGTVEPEVRAELAYRKLLSYRVLWFEKGKPETYPANALTTVTTHDLPTIAGLWSGRDLEVQKELNLSPNVAGTKAMRRALAKTAGVPLSAKADDVVLKTYRALAEAPSLLLTPTLDDALSAEERPNMPGTVDEYPSWRVPLPKRLEEMMKDERAVKIARVMGRRRR
jgi:4-alpha-glucanotransferase